LYKIINNKIGAFYVYVYVMSVNMYCVAYKLPTVYVTLVQLPFFLLSVCNFIMNPSVLSFMSVFLV
jgi:hypothetical protein